MSLKNYFVLYFAFCSGVISLTPDKAALISIEEPNLKQLWENYQKVQLWQEKRKLLWDNPQLQIALGEKFSGTSRGPTFTLALSQNLPMPQRLEIKDKIKNLNIKYYEIEMEKLRQEVAYFAFLAAVKVYLSEEKLEHLKKRQKALEAMDIYLKTKPSVSPKQQAEREIVKSRLLQINQEKLLYQEELIKWQERLYFLTKEKKVELTENFLWPKIHFADLVEGLLQNNLDLLLLNFSLQLEHQKENYAHTLKIPDLNAGIYHTQELAGIPDRFYGLSLSIPLPILDSGTYLAKEAENKKNYYQALYQRKKSELEKELFEKILLYEIYRQNIQNLEFSEEQEIIDTKKSLQYFKFGQIELITFLEWENAVHEKLHIYFQNLEKLYELYLRIQELCGILTPNFSFPEGGKK